MQSPIDLPTKGLDPEEEKKFFKHYENVTPYPWTGIFGDITFSKKSSAIYLALDVTTLANPPKLVPEASEYFATPNYFDSTAGVSQGADNVYYAKQLHFHYGSEHTIDGTQFDFEMHIVHVNKFGLQTGGKAGVIGVIFDTQKYDPNVSDATVEAIDNFFDSMMFYGMQNPKDVSGVPTAYPKEVALGELMAVVNTGNRWVYKGSLTTPPCTEGIYWNVVNTVYPIKKYHLDYYKAAVKKNYDTATKGWENGNYRTARAPGAEHKIRMIKPPAAPAQVTQDDADSAANASLAMVILLCIAMLVALTLIVYSCVLHDKLTKSPDGP